MNLRRLKRYVWGRKWHSIYFKGLFGLSLRSCAISGDYGWHYRSSGSGGTSVSKSYEIYYRSSDNFFAFRIIFLTQRIIRWSRERSYQKYLAAKLLADQGKSEEMGQV